MTDHSGTHAQTNHLRDLQGLKSNTLRATIGKCKCDGAGTMLSCHMQLLGMRPPQTTKPTGFMHAIPMLQHHHITCCTSTPVTSTTSLAMGHICHTTKRMPTQWHRKVVSEVSGRAREQLSPALLKSRHIHSQAAHMHTKQVFARNLQFTKSQHLPFG